MRSGYIRVVAGPPFAGASNARVAIAYRYSWNSNVGSQSIGRWFLILFGVPRCTQSRNRTAKRSTNGRNNYGARKGPATWRNDMNAWDRITDKQIEQAAKRRAAQRRRIGAMPICPTCGGRIKGGRCTGDGVIMCGLHYR